MIHTNMELLIIQHYEYGVAGLKSHTSFFFCRGHLKRWVYSPSEKLTEPNSKTGKKKRENTSHFVGLYKL